MPRQKVRPLRPPEEYKRLYAIMRSEYGGAMALTDVMDALGYRDPKTAREWLRGEGLEAVELNRGKKKWLTCDIARALDNSKLRDSVGPKEASA